MLLHEFLEISARQRPDKVALVSDGQRVTFREFNERGDAWARRLHDAGIRRGDRVVIFLENGVEAAIAIFATLKAGGVFSVINPTTKAERVAFILNDCQAAALISHVDKADVVREAVAAAPQVKCVALAGSRRDGLDLPPATLWTAGFDAGAGEALRPPDPGLIDVDLAALVYTSGSTADPKGVMLTHLNMVTAATSITTYLENVPDDILINVLPLSFDYGLYQLLMAVKFGGTLVLEKSFAYPHALLNKIAAEKVTGFPIVPTLLALLLQIDLSKYDLSRVRYITNTGAALPVDHIMRLRQLLPHVRIFSMYGLTECKRVSYLPPEEIDRRPSSVGRAMPNCEVYIVDEENHRLGPGAIGELVVRGSNVMRGYWNRPDETAKMLRPGEIAGEMVLHTGDLFRVDEDGFIYFVGRRDEMLKSRGEKVSPKEVENVLCNLDGVAEAAVVGVPDEILGQAVKAFVAPRQGAALTEREVLAHCRAHLEDFKVPKFVEFRDEFPRTGSGKVDKKALAGLR